MTVRVSKLFGLLPASAKLAIVFVVTFAAAVHLLSAGYADWGAGPDTFYVMVLLFVFFSRERGSYEARIVFELVAHLGQMRAAVG